MSASADRLALRAVYLVDFYLYYSLPLLMPTLSGAAAWVFPPPI